MSRKKIILLLFLLVMLIAPTPTFCSNIGSHRVLDFHKALLFTASIYLWSVPLEKYRLTQFAEFGGFSSSKAWYFAHHLLKVAVVAGGFLIISNILSKAPFLNKYKGKPKLSRVVMALINFFVFVAVIFAYYFSYMIITAIFPVLGTYQPCLIVD